MSLTSFLLLPDVAERLRPFRPSVRPSDTRPKVPYPGGDPRLTGTAFDYLLRFELQRRAPHARDRRWVAESAPSLICSPAAMLGVSAEADFLTGQYRDRDPSPPELAERAEAVCRGARAAIADYVTTTAPGRDHRRAVAGWAVRLAKLDGVYRKGELDPTFEEAPGEVVDELVALLAVVPFGKLVHPELMLLNPEFGGASRLVGGADADLLAGDLLVDIKTTARADVRGDALDQLFGYFMLARRAGLPPIRRVGIYFSRYGFIRTCGTDCWTSHPEFAGTEEWFFRRAAEVFPLA